MKHPFGDYLIRPGLPEEAFAPGEVLRRMGKGREMRRLFDNLDDVYFFVRDHSGRYMAANAVFLRFLGASLDEELIGLGFEEVHPPEIAAALAREDQEVIRGRHVSIDRPESLGPADGPRFPILTTRLPLEDRAGEIIGVMGVSRRAAVGDLEHVEFSQLDRIAQEIRAAPGAAYRIAVLADRCGLSPRRFNDRFRESFGLAPLEYILRVRVEAAKESLHATCLSLGQIAELHGFVDQAAFTRHFRRITGMTPGAYRKKAAGA